METVYKIEDFVISHLFRPYAPDFIVGEMSHATFEKRQKSIEAMLQKRPELIIELLEDMPVTKERVFNRIRKFGGVRFYKYLDMENELIKWVKSNLAEMEKEK